MHPGTVVEVDVEVEVVDVDVVVEVVEVVVEVDVLVDVEVDVLVEVVEVVLVVEVDGVDGVVVEVVVIGEVVASSSGTYQLHTSDMLLVTRVSSCFPGLTPVRTTVPISPGLMVFPTMMFSTSSPSTIVTTFLISFVPVFLIIILSPKTSIISKVSWVALSIIPPEK